MRRAHEFSCFRQAASSVSGSGRRQADPVAGDSGTARAADADRRQPGRHVFHRLARRAGAQRWPGDAVVRAGLAVAVGGFCPAISVGTQAMVARREGRGETPKLRARCWPTHWCWRWRQRGRAAIVLEADSVRVFDGFPRSGVRAASARPIRAGASWPDLDGRDRRVQGVLRRHGPHVRAFVAAVVMNIVNVALCWLLIFGHLGVPAHGRRGRGHRGCDLVLGRPGFGDGAIWSMRKPNACATARIAGA